MKPEKRHLIHELLDERSDRRREAALLAGGHILRRRRWRRTAVGSVCFVAFSLLIVLSLQRLVPTRTASSPSPVASSRSLTDGELLALFPDTPVGLVTLENGRKRLVFPRPGDEDRFVKRL